MFFYIYHITFYILFYFSVIAGESLATAMAVAFNVLLGASGLITVLYAPKNYKDLVLRDLAESSAYTKVQLLSTSLLTVGCSIYALWVGTLIFSGFRLYMLCKCLSYTPEK